MNKSQLKNSVKNIVAEILELSPDEIVSDDVLFTKQYGADSITGIEILASLEAEFGIHIPEELVTEMNSLSTIYALMPKFIEIDQE